MSSSLRIKEHLRYYATHNEVDLVYILTGDKKLVPKSDIVHSDYDSGNMKAENDKKLIMLRKITPSF